MTALLFHLLTHLAFYNSLFGQALLVMIPISYWLAEQNGFCSNKFMVKTAHNDLLSYMIFILPHVGYVESRKCL